VPLKSLLQGDGTAKLMPDMNAKLKELAKGLLAHEAVSGKSADVDRESRVEPPPELAEVRDGFTKGPGKT
jgi:hypothetical protein